MSRGVGRARRRTNAAAVARPTGTLQRATTSYHAGMGLMWAHVRGGCHER